MTAAGVQMALFLLLGLSALALAPAAVDGHRHIVMHRRRLVHLSSSSSGPSFQHSHTLKHRMVQQVIAAPPKSGYCAEDEPGAPAPFNATGTNITTCVAFYAAPEPLIKVPADTATVKYGLLQGTGPYSLYDRDNKGTPLSAAAAAPLTADAVSKVWSRLVVKGEVDASGQVASFVPVVYVPASAVLGEYVNSQYVSTLTNGGSPPAGVPATSWARWSFLTNVTATGFLVGSFDNLYWSVKDAEGVCQSALCDDPTRSSAACQYFSTLYSENITMTWDSRVFFPGVSGSQVGVFLSNTTFTSYVPATIPAANGFLKPYTFVPKSFVGFNEGNPFNLPFQFTGAFTNVTNGTSIEYC